MFDSLSVLPPDPILGLIAQFQADSRPHKVDLGVGVYRNAQGETPVMASVKQAEARLLQNEITKAYIGPMGSAAFNEQMVKLVLGEQHPQLQQMALAQTPGGCGALRVAAELIKRTNSESCIWVSDPTWGNHVPLLGDAGVAIKEYPYYDFDTHSIRFDDMLACLENIPAKDFVLLHGCCHNPSGADFSQAQWQAITDVAQRRGFIPFIDMAYQGFGEGIEEDAFGIRLMCEQLPEVILALSCSKNFGLYRERVGAVAVFGRGHTNARSHIASIVRGIYSMPPSHGAAIVAEILADASLRQGWIDEVTEMRERINTMRQQLVATVNGLGAGGRFDHIQRQQGMFSFLGLTSAQVAELAQTHGIYMVGTSRISLAGLNDTNIEQFSQALMCVI